MPDVLTYIMMRRSIRKFKDKAIERSDIDLLMEAAMAAPSSCDRKPWEFIVADDRNILTKLDRKLGGGIYNCPLAIVVCGNMDIMNCNACEQASDACREYWVQDCSAATENILIASSGIGLGSVWVGCYPSRYVMESVCNILSIPGNIVPLSIVCIGYPDEVQEPRTSYDKNKIHWGKY